jgi:hypothetical protein
LRNSVVGPWLNVSESGGGLNRSDVSAASASVRVLSLTVRVMIASMTHRPFGSRRNGYAIKRWIAGMRI